MGADSKLDVRIGRRTVQHVLLAFANRCSRSGAQALTKIPRAVAQIVNDSSKSVFSHQFPLKHKLSFPHMLSTHTCEACKLAQMDDPGRLTQELNHRLRSMAHMVSL